MLRCRTESCRILKQFSNQHHESEKTDAQNSRCLMWGDVTKRPEVEQNDATVNEQTGDLLVITCPQQSPYIQANLKVFFPAVSAQVFARISSLEMKVLGKIRRRMLMSWRTKSRPSSFMLFVKSQVPISEDSQIFKMRS